MHVTAEMKVMFTMLVLRCSSLRCVAYVTNSMPRGQPNNRWTSSPMPTCHDLASEILLRNRYHSLRCWTSTRSCLPPRKVVSLRRWKTHQSTWVSTNRIDRYVKGYGLHIDLTHSVTDPSHHFLPSVPDRWTTDGVEFHREDVYVNSTMTVAPSHYIYYRVMIIPDQPNIGPLLIDNNLSLERYWHGQIKDIWSSNEDDPKASPMTVVP